MKKIMIIMFASLLAVQTAAAQRNNNERQIPLYRNELSASYGFLTHTNIGDVVTSSIVGMLSGRNISMSHLGAFNLQYMRALSDKVYVGGAISYEMGKTKKDATTKIAGNYITIMPTVKYYWYDSKHFGVYSRVGAGFTLASYGVTPLGGVRQNFLRADVAFQGSAICIEAGAPWIRGFLECGYGNEGVLVAGVKYCF